MNHDTQTISVGLIGYGYAGKTFHAPLIRSVPGLKLTHVASSKPDVVRAEVRGAVVCGAKNWLSIRRSIQSQPGSVKIGEGTKWSQKGHKTRGLRGVEGLIRRLSPYITGLTLQESSVLNGRCAFDHRQSADFLKKCFR
jgi:hypothetical protein